MVGFHVRRGVRPPHSRLPLRLGRSGDAWPAGMPPRGPSLHLPRGAKCNGGLLIGGGGPSGPPIAGTSSPALRGGAGGGLSAHLALPVVMPPSLEGGITWSGPLGGRTGWTPVPHPGRRWSVSVGAAAPGARMPPSLEGGVTGTLTEPDCTYLHSRGAVWCPPFWVLTGPRASARGQGACGGDAG